jgi:hypothetical protein
MGSPPSHASYWPEVERYFDELPPLLFRQGRLLQANLAAAYSDTGQFRDILHREVDYPWLALPAWLLQDWELPSRERRVPLEKHTTLAALFSCAAIFLQQAILDEGAFFDTPYTFLQQSLQQEADRHFANLFPPDSSFWDYHQAFWREYAEASLWQIERRQNKTPPPDADELLHAARRFAPGKIAAAAVALKASKDADLPRLFSLLDDFCVAWQILQEVLDIRRDVARGFITYPIARTVEAVGIVPGAAVSPERVLGAAVLTGAVGRVCEECSERLDGCRRAADGLGLPSLVGHFSEVQQIAQDVAGLLSMGPSLAEKLGASEPLHPPKVVFTPHVDHLAKACQMAEGYLLSDLTFRESWEVHRRGMFGADEVVSKMPAGLVIEVLCQHGHDMTEAIDAFYRTCQETQFRYYEHPSSTPDTDTLGVLLRLYRYSHHKEAHAKALATPLRWLVENIPASGQIPVWLTVQASSDKDGPFILRFGEGCGVVEAHVLLGLIDYDWKSYADQIQRSALGLLRRFAQREYGITVNYPSLYTLVVMQRLIAALLAHPISPSLERRVEQAGERLLVQLECETERLHITPQDAAFLASACSYPSTEYLFNPRWITVLLKHQRSDGSWQGESFFFVPNRGEALTWYTSDAMTTAFCYHALKTRAGISRQGAKNAKKKEPR